MDHYLENANHEKFPEGQSSWRSFTWDTTTTKSSHLSIKNLLLPAIVELLKPIFDKLKSKEFLPACENVRM